MTIVKGKYNPTVHAVERLREYCGIMEEDAKSTLNQMMREAKYVTTGHEGRLIYKHAKRDVMIVVDGKTHVVVTILPPAGEGDNNSANVVTEVVRPLNVSNAILAAAHATIKRELAKARRTFTSEFRKLKIEQAELGVEIAQATVNKVRCKAPHTQELIQQRIDASQTYYDVVGTKIERVQAGYNRTKTEAQAFLGAEVNV